MNSIKRQRGNLRPAASALTDNGSVYTSRFTHGHNDFERLRASLGITQKDGHPGHPQTQGTIERFHQTPATTTHIFRIRHGTVDQFGKLTLRHGSRLHHLGIGRTHAYTPQQPPHRPRPQLLTQPNKKPRPLAGESVTDDATHV
jgi:hypothetical protein